MDGRRVGLHAKYSPFAAAIQTDQAECVQWTRRLQVAGKVRVGRWSIFWGASLLLAVCFSALMAAAGLRGLPIHEGLLEGERRGS
jgi:hypothetical protein